jgi:hypothetical protein
MLDSAENITERLLNIVMNRYYGKYSGRVTDNSDPDGLGRIEVEVPSLLRKERVWALPCVPFAGDGIGFYMIPEVGTGVWIEFEGGDLSHPIWTGCYWSDGQSPKADSGDEPKSRLIRSEKGLLISLDDAQEILTISDADSDNLVVIDVLQGAVKIKGSISVVVEANNVQLGGQAAVEPVVKGTSLLAYLTALAGAAMIPPPPPNLLSTKVKTE